MTQLDDVIARADAPGGNPGAAEPAGEPASGPAGHGPAGHGPVSGAGGGAEARWLTPADVHNKVFATVRFREGYDLGQVDTFLYEVETTLNRVLRDNAELRARLDSTRHGPGSAADSASRIVALAQQTADRAVAEAQEQAREIIAVARDRAAVVRREALDYGGRLRESLENQIDQLRSLLVELDEREQSY